MKVFYTTTQAGDFRLFKKGDSYRVSYMITGKGGKANAFGGFEILTNDESQALAFFEKYAKTQAGRDVVIFPMWI